MVEGSAGVHEHMRPYAREPLEMLRNPLPVRALPPSLHSCPVEGAGLAPLPRRLASLSCCSPAANHRAPGCGFGGQATANRCGPCPSAQPRRAHHCGCTSQRVASPVLAWAPTPKLTALRCCLAHCDHCQSLPSVEGQTVQHTNPGSQQLRPWGVGGWVGRGRRQALELLPHAQYGHLRHCPLGFEIREREKHFTLQ